MSGVIVQFHHPGHVPGEKLTYSVITARHNGKWIFVRHNERNTLEIPGGHIEDGETPIDAAARELKEETGALDFRLDCVATYSVTMNGSTGWGRLFFAEVFELGKIGDQYEIAEIHLLDGVPEKLTYPEIQPHLFREVIRYIQGRPS